MYKCKHGEADGATGATCASSHGDGTCLLPSQGTELCTGLETPGAHAGPSAVLCPTALHKHCASGLSIRLFSLAWNFAGFCVPEVPCRAQSQARYFSVRPSLPPSSRGSRLFQSCLVPQLPPCSPASAAPCPGPGWAVAIPASPGSPGACPACSPPGPSSWCQLRGSRAVSPAGSLQGRAIPIRHDVSCASLEDIHLPCMVTAGGMEQALSMRCSCCHLLQCHQPRAGGFSVCAGSCQSFASSLGVIFGFFMTWRCWREGSRAVEGAGAPGADPSSLPGWVKALLPWEGPSPRSTEQEPFPPSPVIVLPSPSLTYL